MITVTFAGDESGDVSFAFGKGASRFFAVAMIATEDAEGLRDLMANLVNENHLGERYEFKFHSLTSERLMKSVFDRLGKAHFEAWCMVVDKTQLPDSFRLLKGIDFYLYFVTELIQHVPLEKQTGATLILDEFGSGEGMGSAVRRMLKIRGMPRSFRRIMAKDSAKEPLIQIADLMAGAITHRDERKGSEAYERIAGKIAGEVFYP